MSEGTRIGLRVGIIEPVGAHGGMMYYDVGLCRGLAKAGVKPVLYTSGATERVDGLPFPVLTEFGTMWKARSRWLKGARYLAGLVRSLVQMRRSGTRIAHFHFFQATFLEWLSVLLAKASRARVVITAHDLESLAGAGSHLAGRLTYRAADLVVVHSETSAHELQEMHHLPPRKVQVIPHGNYVGFLGEHLSPETARERVGAAGRGPVVLFFGQIKEAKGLDVLLSAFSRVLAKAPQSLLVIAGRPWKTDFARYELLIDQLGLRSHVVVHLRYIPEREVGQYFRAADLVVLPYRRIYQSGVLLMAMSYARPVLVSDLPAMTEVVRHGENGFVFRSGDVHDLADRMLDALSDGRRLEAVGNAGYQTVATRHSWDFVGERTARAYAAVTWDQGADGCA